MSEKHISQVHAEIQQNYHASENEEKKAGLFSILACPYCTTTLNSLEELVVNKLTGLPECPMCIKIKQAELGDRQ